MKQSRRDVLKSALCTAVLMATPLSLFAASKRALAAGDRFLWVEVQGGRFLALDTQGRDRAFILTTAPLPDGEYDLRGGGKLVVRGGRVIPRRVSASPRARQERGS